MIFGFDVSLTTFEYDIAFKNIEVFGFKTDEHVLGDGYRNSFFSLNLPLYYTYTFKTKFGEINPILGVNVRDLSFILNSGRNHKGVSGKTSEISGTDSTYYNEYNIQFGTKNTQPILMPTLGIRYSKGLANGGTLNFHVIGKLHLRNSNSPEVYLSNYDNLEKNIKKLTSCDDKDRIRQCLFPH